MTPAGEIIAAEIERAGPIPFRRFMEIALYDPQHGYYRRERGARESDPFGTQGDFYTAEQLQPVFGILMAALVRGLQREMDEAREFTVVELGAGRGDMAAAFGEWRYVPVDLGGEMPDHFKGVVFSNEFFDALPVHAAVCRGSEFLERMVAIEGGAFVWREGPPVSEAVTDYLRRYFPAPEEGRVYEANLDALDWMRRIGRSLDSGAVITIDYGYTRAESVRFPAGTLMGYRRHTAREDVLEEPGLRDITAHVNFTAIEEGSEGFGLTKKNLETLAQTLLRAGERDQFAEALGRDDARRRLQLKTLLFGMGETFWVLTQRKEG